MRKLRILFITPAATRSGAPMLMLHLIRYLKQHSNYEMAAVLVSDGAMSAAFAAELPTRAFGRGNSLSLGGRAFYRIPGMRKLRRAAQVAHCRALMKPWPPDVVFCSSVSSAEVLDALGPYRCPVLVNVHELEYALQTWDQILGGAISAMQRHATHYIAASGAVMKNLVARHGVAAERVTVVHEFIDTGEFSGAPFPCESNRSPLASIGVPPDAAVVGVVGSVEWRKGSDLLVALARLLPSTDARGRPIHLVWVGGGYPQDIAQLKFDVTTAGMDERVHIVGATDRSAAWYPAFSVLILPSREDPFPLVALEAAASGLPIVCFADAGGMPEFVEEDAGIVVPFLDLRLFAEAIARLLNDAPLRDEFGRNAASKVRRRHDVSVAVPQLLRVIENQIAAMDSNPDHR